MDKQTQLEIEAQVFRDLVSHLQNNTDLQNIDLMNLAGFCRNCLAKWYQKAADKQGVSLDKPASREVIYGMPYAEWKDKYQK